VLRTALLPGLLKAVRFNVDRQQPDVRFYEIGRVFARPEGDAVVPREREDLAVVLAGDGASAPLAVRIWTVLVRALRLEGVSLEAAVAPSLHPTRTARIVGADGTTLGHVGEVDPDVIGACGLTGRVAWLDVDLEALGTQPTRALKARPVPRYPASDVDLAFVVADAVPAAAVATTLRTSAAGLLEDLRLFDVFRGDQLGAGRRSLAWRLRLRSGERTLTDADLAGVRAAAIEAVGADHGGELRA
jgi:phenylalanyl-tRNA synthetase beta chain